MKSFFYRIKFFSHFGFKGGFRNKSAFKRALYIVNAGLLVLILFMTSKLINLWAENEIHINKKIDKISVIYTSDSSKTKENVNINYNNSRRKLKRGNRTRTLVSSPIISERDLRWELPSDPSCIGARRHSSRSCS